MTHVFCFRIRRSSNGGCYGSGRDVTGRMTLFRLETKRQEFSPTRYYEVFVTSLNLPV